jgi:hypothetical protein
MVYGLVANADRPTFLEELHELCQIKNGPWMLCGNFNMIYRE